MGHFKGKCDKCRYWVRLYEEWRTYRLPGNEMLDVDQTMAWCPVCASVVWAELWNWETSNIRSEEVNDYALIELTDQARETA